MSTAVRPDFYYNMPSLNPAEGGKLATPEELALAAMAKTKGWKVFKDVAKDLVAELNAHNLKAIEDGLPLEEIGRNTVIASLAQGLIERLLNRVVDAEDASESDE